MAGERVLYVCYDPKALVGRERLLIGMGYDVYTVLGVDGLMAMPSVSDFDFILIGDEGPVAERQGAIRCLREQPPMAPVIALRRGIEHIAGADYHVSTAESKAWIHDLVECMRQRRNTA